MLTPSQIKQIAELVNEADIDVKNIDAVNEYVGILLEDIAGFECITDEELAKIQVDVLSALKHR
jgi:phosphoglucomutase